MRFGNYINLQKNERSILHRKMRAMNIEAFSFYHEAQLLGQPRREEAIQKVHEGIACFASLDDALRDAKENIKRYTKSDFPSAHFYEVVMDEIFALLHAKAARPLS